MTDGADMEYTTVADFDRTEFIRVFEAYLSAVLSGCEGRTGEAMRYASLGGGKRVRPLCVYLGARAAGGNADINDILPLAAAIELIHSYSLVHDDMPEMDNGELRRGKPSVHKEYGSATALLTGDGLFSLATDQMLKSKSISAMKELASSALEMVYGQSRELAGCADEADWLEMYSKKTGALIRGAFRAGALCADANEEELNNITVFAECVGLAFQLSDDLLDGDPSILDVIGRERAQNLLDGKFATARETAEKLANSDELIAFANEMQTRKS